MLNLAMDNAKNSAFFTSVC